MFEFKGLANIYLEGHEALEFCSNGNGTIYYVGAPESNITVYDYRCLPGEAAKQALDGENSDAFAELFSQKAWVEVHGNDFATDITITDCTLNEESNITLWLGTLDDNLMSIRNSFWEQIQFLNSKRVAFAALLDD